MNLIENIFSLFIKSLEKEIERAEAVSFEIFETLLLYTTFQPEDFRLELQDYVAERYGIQDFAAIRSNMSCNYPLESMREQYRHEEERYKVDFTDAVNKELELLKKYTTVNPLIYKLFQQAIDKNKTVVLFSECSYTIDEIKDLLEFRISLKEFSCCLSILVKRSVFCDYITVDLATFACTADDNAGLEILKQALGSSGSGREIVYLRFRYNTVQVVKSHV